MRKLSMFVAGAAVILLSVALVEGQQGDKKRQFGGGRGGMDTRQQDPLVLLRNPTVKKELDISEEQLEKLPAEVMAAIGKVLNETQMKRFKQIELQQRGNDAFKDAVVKKELKMTDDQEKNILTILEDASKERGELTKKGGGGADFKGRAEKLETIKKDAKEKIYTVLNKEQRKTWRDMIGEELKIERTGFGGFDFGGFGKGKKKDENK